MLRTVKKISQAEVISQWNALAPVRYRQIISGEDITYVRLLVPSVIALIPGGSETLLDAGCGVGILTNQLAIHAKSVVGIDPSSESVSIARAHFEPQAQFEQTTLEECVRVHPQTADLVVANMVLMDILDLEGFLESARRVLLPGGSLVFSITHPCFWPDYRGYARASWFDYAQESIIEAPFRITAEPDCELPSIHVHRPLQSYFESLRNSKFSVEILSEPMPSADVMRLYPEAWKHPRYLLARCRAM
jgi:SAM-dependent methyltransferase